MNILHLEASPGWGGQEMRILNEAKGMKERGHRVIIAVATGGKLIKEAKDSGFMVFQVNFKKLCWFISLFRLIHIIWKYDIDIINTHSSLDAWLGGIVGRLLSRKVVRTRHLSTPIRKGWNSCFLYHYLADYVVTTCEKVASKISDQSGKPKKYCTSIPTGVNFNNVKISSEEAMEFRRSIGAGLDDCLIGMVCFMRSWKGVDDFINAANILRDKKNIKWVIIGGGFAQKYKLLVKKLGLEKHVHFTDHLSNPFPGIASLDIFSLLSTAHEGVSQASLQAAFLEKPLITTSTGGLWEVCIDKVTGIQVPLFAPQKVAEAMVLLQQDPMLRKNMGMEAKKLVLENFTYTHMLDKMEEVYRTILRS
jgi:glycosyltransferase involved in cell wall biosynthesis